MRTIGWSLLILLAVAWLASEVAPAGNRTDGKVTTAWRRTRDGWERPGWLTSSTRSCRPTLHPTVVALAEILLAVAALVALSETKDRQPRPAPKPADGAPLRRSSRFGPYRFMQFRQSARRP
jgi:hypothetical protein